MTVSGLEGCEAGIYADVGRRLVDAETEAGNFDSGVGEREEVCEGEFGGRHGGLGVGLGAVECFRVCFAFVRCLVLGGQRAVVGMDVSTVLESVIG